MAREQSRVAQGYFPTQEKICDLIASCFTAPPTGTASIVDAGAGEGAAIAQLKAKLGGKNLRTLGVESDQTRAERAAKVLDETLWCSIEDTSVHPHCSLLWFNPVYDRVRGVGRSECDLWEDVYGWPAVGAYVVIIVPDHVMTEWMARSVERLYDCIGFWRYPEPEYSQWKQSVYIGRRRAQQISPGYGYDMPWLQEPLPVLSEHPITPIQLPAMTVPHLVREKLSQEVLVSTVKKSPLRYKLLEKSVAQPPPARPLLPLRAGHLAMVIAGGYCDGVIEQDGKRFIMKGVLDVGTKTETRTKKDGEGNVVAEIEATRTTYGLRVRCVTDKGELEEFTTDKDEEAVAHEDQD